LLDSVARLLDADASTELEASSDSRECDRRSDHVSNLFGDSRDLIEVAHFEKYNQQFILANVSYMSPFQRITAASLIFLNN